MEMDGNAFPPLEYLFGISILQERVKNINLLQFPLLVERLTGSRGCQSVVGAHFVLRLLRRIGWWWEQSFVNPPSHHLLEGDFGSQEIHGPLGEHSLVVLVHNLWARQRDECHVGQGRRDAGDYLLIWPCWPWGVKCRSKEGNIQDKIHGGFRLLYT